MLDEFIYENHLGQRFVGLDFGVYLNSSELRNYSWKYDTINSAISRFYRPTTNRKIPLVVCGYTDEEAMTAMNRLVELAESDIAARNPGKIIVGEYYTNGYITSSKKKTYLLDKRLCSIELVMTSDDPTWYREKTHAFFPKEEPGSGNGGGTDYTYDYPYDYALSVKDLKIMCDSIGNNGFRMCIYGEATNPSVAISGHAYTINGSVGKGETLEIDSLKKTITLTTAQGNKINWFDKRGREEYIFEPIPAGQNTVSWLGTFGFDLTVIEKRSEPRWT